MSRNKRPLKIMKDVYFNDLVSITLKSSAEINSDVLRFSKYALYILITLLILESSVSSIKPDQVNIICVKYKRYSRNSA